jgi:hypothetical protein
MTIQEGLSKHPGTPGKQRGQAEEHLLHDDLAVGSGEDLAGGTTSGVR